MKNCLVVGMDKVCSDKQVQKLLDWIPQKLLNLVFSQPFTSNFLAFRQRNKITDTKAARECVTMSLLNREADCPFVTQEALSVCNMRKQIPHFTCCSSELFPYHLLSTVNFMLLV